MLWLRICLNGFFPHFVMSLQLRMPFIQLKKINKTSQKINNPPKPTIILVRFHEEFPFCFLLIFRQSRFRKLICTRMQLQNKRLGRGDLEVKQAQWNSFLHNLWILDWKPGSLWKLLEGTREILWQPWFCSSCFCHIYCFWLLVGGCVQMTRGLSKFS